MTCSKCRTENAPGAKFCIECGESFKGRCPKCGLTNPANAKFCQECGTSFGEAAETKKNVRDGPSDIRISSHHLVGEIPDGERKTVTALFADIKGSTELERDLDPEEARAIVDPVLRLMMDAVHRYGGYVAQSTGDGIFALFGAPAAHEDHPQRALYAALAMQEELHRYADRLRAEGKPAVEARVGLNTGEVVVRTIETGGHTEYTPIGHVTNLAARMQTAAPSGSIAASEATRRLCEGYFEFRALGPTAIKGLDAPVEVHEVVRAGPLRTHFQLAARRGLTRFVGRERELTAMAGALERARAGHGQIVAAVGDAGAGKSRLTYEFKATIPDGWKVLQAYSVSHGKASAWLPVMELLHHYFGIEGTDDPAARREKVKARLARLDTGLIEMLPYLFALFGITDGPDPFAQMDPQVKQRRTLEAIKRIMLRESLNQPLVVVFEDLHWIDDQTQALLDLLVDSVATARILILVNYRPEYHHEWGNKSYYLQLRLDPLTQENACDMLDSLLGASAELSPLKRTVIDKTQGNPFFIEEIVQTLFEQRVLTRNGEVRITQPVSMIRIPTTVQGVLASRIDRLGASEKDLLQTLAVIGKEFLLTLIKKVVNIPEHELSRILSDLATNEFIYAQPAITNIEYVFKHALTQEVAYNSLLIERRKLLHERTGYALEAMFADQLDDHLSQLAHHYRCSENVGKAIEYLGKAARQAIERSSYADAIDGLNTAIDLLQRLPNTPDRLRRELSLQLVLGTALIATKGFAAKEVEKTYSHARKLCEQIGDSPQFFRALLGLWVVHMVGARLQTAHELADRLLKRAESAHDPSLLCAAHQALGATSYWMGDLVPAKRHIDEALSLLSQERRWMLGVDLEVGCLVYAASILWALGYPDQALQRGNQAVARAKSLHHPHSMAFSGVFLSGLYIRRGGAREAQVTAESVIALSTEHGFPQSIAYGTNMRAAAVAMQGRNEEAIVQMREGLAASAAIGTMNGRSLYLTLLAKAQMEMGQYDKALSALSEATVFSDQHGERVNDAETYRFKGELMLKREAPNLADAEVCFEQALETARKQGAKTLELRATMSLAQLLRDTDRRNEARAMLAEIYNWFSEGFDTADLKDAKALLDELNRGGS